MVGGNTGVVIFGTGFIFCGGFGIGWLGVARGGECGSYVVVHWGSG